MILDEPLKTEQRGGVSDANVVSAAGVPTLDGFGPYGDGDHTIHERALKSSFELRIRQVTQILSAWCYQIKETKITNSKAIEFDV
jgi:glutamate carboxypeptidase